MANIFKEGFPKKKFINKYTYSNSIDYKKNANFVNMMKNSINKFLFFAFLFYDEIKNKVYI